MNQVGTSNNTSLRDTEVSLSSDFHVPPNTILFSSFSHLKVRSPF